MLKALQCLLRILLFAVPLFFALACTHAPTSISENSRGEKSLVGDSIRVKFKLEVPDESGKMQKLDAVMFSVPGKRYRLELSGPMGIGVASMLWTDTLWTIVFPTEKKFLKGNGYMVGLLTQPGAPLVNVHQIAGFFEQKYLPENYEEISSRDSSGVLLVEAKDQLGSTFKFAKAQEKVLWLERGAERAVFNWPEIRVVRDGLPYMSLTVKKVQNDVNFSGSTWRLPVPHGYQPF